MHKKLYMRIRKEVLIKSMVQATPLYARSILRFPSYFCKEINLLVANFWRSRNSGSKGIHWKSWDCLSKTNFSGGLGFRDFDLMNITALAKQAWSILCFPQSKWSLVLKGIYFPNSSFWVVPRNRSGSWI